MTPEELARKAQQLLDDPLVQQIFAQLDDRYVDDFRKSLPADTAKRETAHARLMALKDVRSALAAFVTDAKIRAHNSGLKNGEK